MRNKKLLLIVIVMSLILFFSGFTSAISMQMMDITEISKDNEVFVVLYWFCTIQDPAV